MGELILVPHTANCKSCGHIWQGIGLCCPRCGSVTVYVENYTMYIAAAEEEEMSLGENETTDGDGNVYRVKDVGCLECWEGFNDDEFDGVRCPSCGSENILKPEPL